MMIKFFGGSRAASAVANYLTSALDAKGQEREEVKVLRGDPHQVGEVAEALEFEHKHTSGVIAWSPEDAPSEDQIDTVLDEFEKTAWAGLEPDRYAWSAVQHRDAKGGVHVHVLAARCDLESGKSLNIAPPGWQKTFDALRDWQNHENNWSRPDDPERARVVQPGHRAYSEAAQLRAGLGERKRPPGGDHRLSDPAGRARRCWRPRRSRHGAPGGGTGGAAARPELHHSGGPRQRGTLAVERSHL